MYQKHYLNLPERTARGLFCTDGNGNTVNSSSTVFTVTAAASPGGGGGSTITILQGDHCDFSIIRPTIGFVNTLCPTGRTSGSFEFVLQNEEVTTQTYTTAFHNVDLHAMLRERRTKCLVR